MSLDIFILWNTMQQLKRMSHTYVWQRQQNSKTLCNKKMKVADYLRYVKHRDVKNNVYSNSGSTWHLCKSINKGWGTSLVVQWVRLHAPNAGGLGSTPGGGTRSHMHAATKSLHAATKKILCATTKSWCRLNK